MELVEERLPLCGRELSILRPREPDALLDEEAFEQEQFLPYWAELWPSSLALTRLVCELPIRGVRVVELGCGLGLPSIAAALRGAEPLATDWSPDALRFVEVNAERNGTQVETALCDWSRPDSLVERGPWKVVLASDVLYEPRNIGLMLGLLPRLVATRGQAFLADPGRMGVTEFLTSAASAWRIDAWGAPDTPSVHLYQLRKLA